MGERLRNNAKPSCILLHLRLCLLNSRSHVCVCLFICFLWVITTLPIHIPWMGTTVRYFLCHRIHSIYHGQGCYFYERRDIGTSIDKK